MIIQMRRLKSYLLDQFSYHNSLIYSELSLMRYEEYAHEVPNDLQDENACCNGCLTRLTVIQRRMTRSRQTSKEFTFDMWQRKPNLNCFGAVARKTKEKNSIRKQKEQLILMSKERGASACHLYNR